MRTYVSTYIRIEVAGDEDEWSDAYLIGLSLGSPEDFTPVDGTPEDFVQDANRDYVRSSSYVMEPFMKLLLRFWLAPGPQES